MKSTHHLAALWFADIVGFSDLAGVREDDALVLVEVLQSAASTAVSEHDGRIVKFLGDGVLAEFSSAERAVRAALALSAAFGERASAGHELRVGVHLGEVATAADGDLYGDGVNMAARIQAEAPSGRVVVSGDVWRQLRRRSGFAFESLGPRDIKGAAEPIEIYAIRPEGEPAVKAALPSPGAAVARRFRSKLWLAASVVMIAGAATWWGTRASPRPIAASPSVAVLPFENLSADPDDAYFSDGVTEEIVTTLARIGDLKVIGRTSVERYRDSALSVREIADELGVATVLEGSVQRVGEKVRIRAQLIDASSTEHLWADSYERDISDIFAIQTDVAEQIARSLRRALSASERERLASSSTSDVEAYEAYLRARYLWNQRTEEAIYRAIELFESAIDRDSDYALAHLGLAEAWAVLPGYSDAPASEALPRARVAAEQALEIDPRLGGAEAVLAAVAYQLDYDWASAGRAFERSLELSPGNPTARHWYALFLVAQGRVDEAFEQIQRAREIDPLSLVINAEVGWVHYFAGDFPRAIEAHQRVVTMDEAFPLVHEFLWQTYEQSGRFAEAAFEAGRVAALYDWPGVEPEAFETALRSAYDEAGAMGYWRARREWLDRMARRSVITGPVARAGIEAALGEKDAALSILSEAVAEYDPFVTYLKVEPAVDPLRGEAEFDALLTEIGLNSR